MSKWKGQVAPFGGIKTAPDAEGGEKPLKQAALPLVFEKQQTTQTRKAKQPGSPKSKAEKAHPAFKTFIRSVGRFVDEKHDLKAVHCWRAGEHHFARFIFVDGQVVNLKSIYRAVPFEGVFPTAERVLDQIKTKD